MSELSKIVQEKAPENHPTAAGAVLTLNEGSDYVLGRAAGDYVWIAVENISIKIKREAECVVIDCYPRGSENREPVAAAYAFYTEAQEAIDEDCTDDERRRIAEDCALPETRHWNETAVREFVS